MGPRDAADSGAEEGPVDLSYVVRMDLRITDPDALIMGARQAALSAEPGVDPDELARQVCGVEDALFCYANTLGFDSLLEDAPGVEVRTVAAEVAYDLEEIVVTQDDREGDA